MALRLFLTCLFVLVLLFVLIQNTHSSDFPDWVVNLVTVVGILAGVGIILSGFIAIWTF